MNERDDLSPEEAAALSRLSHDADVPPSLEERTVSRLRTRGLLGVPGGRRMRWLAAAAGLALFAAGLLVGGRRAAAPAAASELPRYVLLLYDAPNEAALTEAEMGERVEEYRSWAVAVRRAGGAITGEKLAASGQMLGPPIAAPGARSLGGYFVIGARDAAAALELARGCPHLKHGGSIEVRPIEKT